MRTFSLLVLAVSLTACSLVIDTDQYRGGSGTDGGPGGDGGPGTDGDIDTDGDVHTDGTMTNQPPVLTTAGLSTYRPIVGDMVRAFPGRVVDPEGDPTTVLYQWYAGGEPISGATGPTLTVTEDMRTAGDLSLEAWAVDTAEGPRVTVGPVQILENVTQWRPLLPMRGVDDIPIIVYDEQHNRVVFVTENDGTVWEYALDPGNQRFARLYPSGTTPRRFAARAVYDPINDRMLVFGGVDASSGGLTSELVELDLSTRGAEAWRTISPGGSGAPTARAFPGMAVDERNQRVYVYGGLLRFEPETDEHIATDFWLLDISDAGSETWQAVPALSADPRVSPTMVVHPTEDILYVFGGGGIGRDELLGKDTILRMDVTPGSGSVTELSTRLPAGAFGSMGLADAARNRILVAFGVSGGGDPITDVWAFDLATETITTVSTSGTGPTSGAGGFLAHLPAMDQAVAVPLGVDASAIDFYRLDLAADEWTTIDRLGTHAPHGLTEMAASSDFGVMRIFGGMSSGNNANDQVWELDLDTGEWSIVATEADAVTGNVPAGRWGIHVQANSAYGAPILFAGGVNETGALDMVAWELMETRWVERTLGTGGSPPASRVRATYFDPACGARVLGMFGGRLDTRFELTAETWFLECPTGDRPRDCSWSDPVGEQAKPSPRADARVVHTTNELVLVGGITDSGAVMDVHTLDPCLGSDAPWNAVTPAGTTPPARGGHTLINLTPSASSSADPVEFVMIGGTDGTSEFNDVWKLSRLSDTAFRWDAMNPGTEAGEPMPRSHHAVAIDREGGTGVRRIVVWGGENGGDVLGDLWELRVVEE